ncbi:MAG: acyl-CoA thioesterase [Denitromonas halophila]|nr:MAG: acyl-CoA thioesterase [Denitromonas halophila]TVT73294.1 MAG: acyl-CoA thioesterase [Denitromonas halophila]
MSARPKIEVEVDVPFFHVDVMEVVWHGHYVQYFEQARTVLLRSIDYDYPQMRASGYAWPVVECHIKYVKPARYGQKIRIEAALVEAQNRLKIAYTIRDAATGQRLTRAYTIQVAVDMASGELQFVSPPALLDRMGGTE